jgi:hypothetical protein
MPSILTDAQIAKERRRLETARLAVIEAMRVIALDVNADASARVRAAEVFLLNRAGNGQ